MSNVKNENFLYTITKKWFAKNIFFDKYKTGKRKCKILNDANDKK